MASSSPTEASKQYPHDKDQLRRLNRFFDVDPADIETFDEWGEYLESLLTGPCVVREVKGELTLLEIKALVDEFRGLRIEINPREHPPPHFHVRSSKVNATFAIEDCRLLSGKVPDNEQSKIRYWHKAAKSKLIDKWNLLRPTECTVGPYRGT